MKALRDIRMISQVAQLVKNQLSLLGSLATSADYVVKPTTSRGRALVRPHCLGYASSA